MPRFKFDFHNTQSEVEITRQGNSLHVSRDKQSFELLLKHQDGQFFVLEMLYPDGRRRQIRAAGHGQQDHRQIWVNGRYHDYIRVRERGSGGPVDGSLSSSIPAVVTQVLVNIGDKVSEGEKLILLESMKMVIPIQAPRNGTVKAIHCAAGDSIQAGVPLVEIEDKQSDE